MFNALIVDDEPLVQVGIQSMLDWQALDIRLLPSLPNGLAAFEVIKEKKPDIVLTDVRMPLLDGLGLIKRCKSELAEPPEFIVMSSYKEFSYVREAMKFQAVDYLIKLEITAQTLTESLERAKKSLEIHRPHRTGATEAGGGAANASALVDRVFQKLLQREYSDKTSFLSDLDKLGTGFAGELFGMIVCKAVFPESPAQNDDERLRSYFCAVTTMQDMLGREYAVHSQYVDREHFLLFVAVATPSRHPGANEARLQNAVSSACTMVFKYFNIHLRCGISSLNDDPLRSPVLHAEALSAMERSGELHPVSSYRPEPEGEAVLGGGQNLRENLERALHTLDESACVKVREDAIALLTRRDTSFTSAVDVCAGLCHAVIDTVENGEALLDGFFPEGSDGYKSLYAMAGTQNLVSWLRTMFAGIESELIKAKAGHRDGVAQAMRHFVDSRFKERLTLNEVAEHFGLSPNYAGAIFKKHTGYGFPEYVARLKVEKARAIMDQGGYRMYEISDLVGFESAFYFSKVFKRICGLSPTEYAAKVKTGA